MTINVGFLANEKRATSQLTLDLHREWWRHSVNKHDHVVTRNDTWCPPVAVFFIHPVGHLGQRPLATAAGAWREGKTREAPWWMSYCSEWDELGVIARPLLLLLLLHPPRPPRPLRAASRTAAPAWCRGAGPWARSWRGARAGPAGRAAGRPAPTTPRPGREGPPARPPRPPGSRRSAAWSCRGAPGAAPGTSPEPPREPPHVTPATL